MEGDRSSRWLRPGLVVAETCAALNAAGARYLVIGEAAGILHGDVRASTGLEILIEPSPGNAARVLAALGQLGHGFAREWLADEVARRPVTVIGNDPTVAIFTQAWSVRFDTAIGRAWAADVDGVTIPVIGLDDLIATKRAGMVPDNADIEVLEEIRRGRAVSGER